MILIHNMYFWRQLDRLFILYKREVWNKLGPCFNSLCASSLPNLKEQPFCFIKSSSLNLDFIHWEMNRISNPIKRLEK